MRCFGVAWLVSFLLGTVLTRPNPGLHGRGAVVLSAVIGLVVAAVATRPQDAGVPVRQRIAGLVGVTAAAAELAALQPNGSWQNGPLLVGIIAALRLERLLGILMLGFSDGDPHRRRRRRSPRPRPRQRFWH